MEYRSKELYADFYEHPGKPLVVLVGGSRAGIPMVSETLLGYLKENYNVLVMAYFGVGSLPKHLERVPLEYFVDAIEGLKNRLHLRDEDVTLIGSSKGGELVLLLASHYVRAQTVIACVPSCYVWQAIPYGLSSLLFPKSSWALRGKDVPFARFRYDRNILRDLKKKRYSSCHEKSIAMNRNEAALIDLSEFSGTMYLLSAERDPYWPSKGMCENLMASGNEKMSHRTLDLEGHYFLQYEESGRELISFLRTNR